MRDRVKASINHSKMESTSNNGEVKWKIIQVRMNTRRKKRKQINVKSEKEKKMYVINVLKNLWKTTKNYHWEL